MTVDRGDAAFVRTLEAERATLQGTAYLLVDDPRAAARVLDSVVARLYGRVPPQMLRVEVLRSLVSHDARLAPLPWSRVPRFELVDGSARIKPAGIVADLGGLPRDQRAVVVLEQYTGLPVGQIADLLDRPVEDVRGLAGLARAALTAGHAERQGDQSLSAELRSAVPEDLRVARGAAVDLARGRRLVRRRQWRVGSALGAGAVAAVVLISQLWLQPTRTPQATNPISSPPVPAAPATPVPRATCDPSGTTCRSAILQDWRREMVLVTNANLDPKGTKAFRDTSTAAPSPASSFWSGRGGSLALELTRVDQGVTQVSVQIASSRDFAWQCGETTHTRCVVMRFMDGNTFTMSDSDGNRGVEVQYSPYGDQVITATARTKLGQGHGTDELPVTRGDLVNLVQDRRLRLPNL